MTSYKCVSSVLIPDFVLGVTNILIIKTWLIRGSLTRYKIIQDIWFNILEEHKTMGLSSKKFSSNTVSVYDVGYMLTTSWLAGFETAFIHPSRVLFLSSKVCITQHRTFFVLVPNIQEISRNVLDDKYSSPEWVAENFLPKGLVKEIGGIPSTELVV